MTTSDVRSLQGGRQRRDLSYIGLGANLQHPDYGSPQQTLEAAIAALIAHGLVIIARSSWYESAPVPIADQPWYVNGVVAIRSTLSAQDLLKILHQVEAEFGRVRSVINAPRVIDLDLLDHRGECQPGDGTGLVLPHPRMADRSFVLLPLQEIAPNWRHPVSGRNLQELIAALPADQITRLLTDR
jgi:2-amino-4-hydroxy-6-hydroxymethyldihydropteridine diphosphokinase